MAAYNYTGTSGNNTISPGQNYTDYYIDGGAGTDTVYIDAAKSNFTISPIDTNGVITISGASAGNKKLYLTNVEKVSFKSGGTVDLPTASATTQINGTSGNDSLTGTSGNNTIDGGLGVDTVVLTGLASTVATLTKSGNSWTLSSAATGTDTLSNIERIQFSDKKIALDVTADGNAGKALEFIGMLAFNAVTDKAIVGEIISYFDQIPNMLDICQLAVNVGLTKTLAGNSASNAALAQLVFRNVVGQEASAGDVDSLVSYMDGRNASMSQAEFLTAIAQLDFNQQHVGLVGLQGTGVEYIFG